MIQSIDQVLLAANEHKKMIEFSKKVSVDDKGGKKSLALVVAAPMRRCLLIPYRARLYPVADANASLNAIGLGL